MATYQTVKARTMLAAADLSQRLHHILRASAEGECNVASNAAGGADDVVGVLQNNPTSGHHATVGYAGISKVVAGAAVTANRMITTNDSGRAIHAGSGQWTLGQALTAANGDGEVISVLLNAPATFLPHSAAAL